MEGIRTLADFFARKILKDLGSRDIASSYPTEICCSKVPVSEFQILNECSEDKLHELIDVRGKAVLMRLSLIDIELKDDLIPVPYIPVSKCKGLYKAAEDNGRVLSAEVIGEITLTDIDYNIIRKQYKFKIAAIHTVATARYGMLPAPLRECVLTYYRDKTQLKDKPTDQDHTAEFYELLYQKSKNLLNAQYGMCAQDPVKVTMKYTNGNNKDPEDNDLYEEDDTAPEDLLEQYNKRAFLVYQWGVW